ncbi:hypothetical protein [Streptomyces sp. Amel2xC10]|uniref:hypothetical protein n=1 Tax=Streptomyces sp. Amel2xC10 TaxID=1305826 RepID=UPI000A08C322|nr:hypothetical protein [Streptomyces sp. Amel2xC10]SMF86447.1 hypothetical protein SAMN02745830_07171 [Streptomyces sp. Amel2xC10]
MTEPLDFEREQKIAAAVRRRDAVLRLLEGRPGNHLLTVAEIAAAAEYGTTAHDGLPMTLTWTRSARVPDAHDAHKQVIVECISSYGGRADLVVEGDARMALASLLDAETIRDINAPCPHGQASCGSYHDLDEADMFGWFRLDVGGLDDGPRWYCSPGCVNAAMQRAGDDLALADQAAAVAPDQQDPEGWPPNGGHDSLCSYASGIGRDCTCPVTVAHATISPAPHPDETARDTSHATGPEGPSQ